MAVSPRKGSFFRRRVVRITVVNIKFFQLVRLEIVQIILDNWVELNLPNKEAFFSHGHKASVVRILEKLVQVYPRDVTFLQLVLFHSLPPIFVSQKYHVQMRPSVLTVWIDTRNQTQGPSLFHTNSASMSTGSPSSVV